MSPGGATLKYELRRLEKENEANRHVQISEHKGVEVSQKCIKKTHVIQAVECTSLAEFRKRKSVCFFYRYVVPLLL